MGKDHAKDPERGRLTDSRKNIGNGKSERSCTRQNSNGERGRMKISRRVFEKIW